MLRSEYLRKSQSPVDRRVRHARQECKSLPTRRDVQCTCERAEGCCDNDVTQHTKRSSRLFALFFSKLSLLDPGLVMFPFVIIFVIHQGARGHQRYCPREKSREVT
jgi:hypothetical protein